MAYYLNLADVDKARAIANKALSTISFRSVYVPVSVTLTTCYNNT